MRHGKKFNHLGRKAPHRKAMLANMASSLLKHKRINTTVAKAKALRTFIEPLLTRAKDDTTHSRRMVFRYLRDKYAVTELFRDVAPKIADRPGGYTRILKTGNRMGDNAEMCLIELVDFNEVMLADPKAAGAAEKKPRTRRGKKKKEGEPSAKPVKAEAKVEDKPAIEDAEIIEEVKEEKVEEITTDDTSETKEEVADTKEEPTAETTEEAVDATDTEAKVESPDEEDESSKADEAKEEEVETPAEETKEEPTAEASEEEESKDEEASDSEGEEKKD